MNGDVPAVQEYLETSREARLFVQGRDPGGKTMLICASAEQSSEMVSLLIQHGADVDSVDNHGRSALMEAALFGRVDNVKVLLGHNADKNLRDNENSLAIDSAREHYKNRREVYERTGGNLTSSSKQRPRHTMEDAFKRDIDRREIVRLLGGEDRKSRITYGRPPTLSLSRSYTFTRSPMQDSFELRGPIEKYPVTSSWKTVARLERGGKFPSVSAMSGWSHTSVQSLRVNGQQWTDDVFYVSQVVGHLLPPDAAKDRGKKGRYNACHAEKQLIAYFIDRHVLLPRDGLPDSELEGDIEQVEDELDVFLSDTETGRQVTLLRERQKNLDHELLDWDGKLVGKYDETKALKLRLKSFVTALDRLIATPQARPLLKLESRLDTLNRRRRRHADLINMANAPPPASLTEAVILVSSSPCPDCIEFTRKVNESFRLFIQLFAAL